MVESPRYCCLTHWDFLKKELIIFHFSKNMFSFSKWVSNELSFSKCGSLSIYVFIFKMWKILWVFVSFSEKHNCKQQICKQKFVQSLQIALLMRLWLNIEIYIKLRDVSAGATGVTVVAPKFSDTLTLSQPGGGGRFCPPSQRSHLNFPHSYVPVTYYISTYNK